MHSFVLVQRLAKAEENSKQKLQQAAVARRELWRKTLDLARRLAEAERGREEAEKEKQTALLASAEVAKISHKLEMAETEMQMLLLLYPIVTHVGTNIGTPSMHMSTHMATPLSTHNCTTHGSTLVNTHGITYGSTLVSTHGITHVNTLGNTHGNTHINTLVNSSALIIVCGAQC